jgi:hypothetical protein
MTIRKLIDTIDLMEAALDTPLEFDQTSPDVFKFSFETPDGELQRGNISIKKSYSPAGKDSERQLDPYDEDEEIAVGHVLCTINDSFHGFNTKGYARRILSTVVACTHIWLEQNPEVEYIRYEGYSDPGALHRPQVYHALTNMFANKLGYKVIGDAPAAGDTEASFLIRVK